MIPALDCSTCGALGSEACLEGCGEERARRALVAKMGIGASPRGLEDQRRAIEREEGGISPRARAVWGALRMRAHEVLQSFALQLGRLDEGTLALLAKAAVHREVRWMSAGELARRRELEV